MCVRWAALLCDWVDGGTISGRVSRTGLTLICIEVKVLTRQWTAALITRIICGGFTEIRIDTLIPHSDVVGPVRWAALLCGWVEGGNRSAVSRTELTLVGIEVKVLTQQWTAALITRLICGGSTEIRIDTLIPHSTAPIVPDVVGSVRWAVVLPPVLDVAKVELWGRSVRRILHLLVLVVLVCGLAVRVVRVQGQSS